MKRKLYLSICLSISLIGLSAQISPDLAGRLQNTLDSIGARYQLKGATAALLLPNVGTWTGTYGISKPGVPVNSSMAFGMGSNTKTYISVLLLKLQEKGLLSLDDSIGKWIQGYKHVHTKATIRQCLNHTAGHKEYLNAKFNDSLLLNPSKIWTMEEVLLTLDAPNFAPGASWGYSNTNYILAGMVIEKATQMSFANAMEFYVLEPNNWNSTFFFGTPNPAPIPSQWTMNLTGTSQVEMNTYPVNIINQLFSAAGPAGAMMVTAEENVQFWYKLIKENLLTPASLKELTTTVRLNNFVSYGLGIFRYNREINNRTVYSHGGTFIGFINENIVDTLSGVTISVLSNQDSLDNDFFLSILIPALHKHVLNAPPTGLASTENRVLLSVYPNPANATLHIALEGDYNIQKYQLIDSRGALVLSQDFNQQAIDVSALNEGLYFLQLLAEENVVVAHKKVLIKH